MKHELSPADQRMLAAARLAWRAAVPTDVDVEQAVKRLTPRLERKRQHRPLRHAGRLAVIFVVLGAGLAWAAGGGSRFSAAGSWPLEPLHSGGARSAGGAVSQSARLAATPAPALAEEALSPGLEPALEAPSVAPPRPTRAARGTPPLAAPSGANANETSTWRRVREALAEGDAPGAEVALSELGASQDPDTRVKAELGLAQLALARGDCARASAIAQGILARSADGTMRARARDVIARCPSR